MAKGIYAAAYHVRVKEKFARTHQRLDQIAGTKDFLKFVEDLLNTCKKEHHDDEASERIAMTDRIHVDDRIIRGRILVGDYGQECNVFDKRKGKAVYKKSVDDADALPFYFRLEVPGDHDEGLLLIEKSRKTSPTGAFRGLLKKKFREHFPELTLTIDPVMPENVYLAYLEKGTVQKITFIRMGLPTDIAELLDGGHFEKHGKTEYVITASKNRSLPIKKSLFKGDNPMKAIQDLYELKDLEYENVKIDVRLGKNRRSVDLGKKHSSPLYDLSNVVRKGKDGTPIYESIEGAFDDLADDIKEGAYGTA